MKFVRIIINMYLYGVKLKILISLYSKLQIQNSKLSLRYASTTGNSMRYAFMNPSILPSITASTSVV